MMAIMRKLIDSKAYKVILWTMLCMMILGSGVFMHVGGEEKWVLKVYNELLSPERFHTILKAQRAEIEQYKSRGVILAGRNAGKDAVRASVANLLSEHVLRSLHVSVPLSVVEEEFRKKLSGLPAQFFRPNGELNEQVLAQAIAPQTIESFFEELSKETKGHILSSIVNLGSYTPLFEVRLHYAVEYAQKDYSVMKFASSKYVQKAKEVSPSSETLEKFYKKSKNSELFKTPEKRAGKVWRFDSDSYNITVTEGDIKKEYEKNKSAYLERPAQMQLRLLSITKKSEEGAARKKIDELHKEAEKNPENFEKLVKEFSEDTQLEKSNGLTKFLSQDSTELDKVLLHTAFETLFTDGQISMPIQTERGYEIVQRVKKTPAQYKDLATVSAKIKDELVAAKFKARFAQDANRILNEAKYNPEVFKKFAAKGTESSIPLTAKKAEVAIAQLFRLEEGRYAVFFDKKDGIILQCTTVEKSKLPALCDIKEEVTAKYYEEEGSALLEKDLSKALEAVRAGKDMAEVAREFNVKVERAHTLFKGDQKEQSPVLQNRAVQSKLKNLSSKGALTSVIDGANGYIIRLDAIEDFDVEKLLQDKEMLLKTISYAKTYQVKEGFIASLYRRAKLDNKIEMKQEVLQFLKEA